MIEVEFKYFCVMFFFSIFRERVKESEHLFQIPVTNDICIYIYIYIVECLCVNVCHFIFYLSIIYKYKNMPQHTHTHTHTHTRIYIYIYIYIYDWYIDRLIDKLTDQLRHRLTGFNNLKTSNVYQIIQDNPWELFSFAFYFSDDTVNDLPPLNLPKKN